MKKRLAQLHNTLCMIRTSGEDTLLMAECIRCVRELGNEVVQSEKEGVKEDVGCASEDS